MKKFFCLPLLEEEPSKFDMHENILFAQTDY
jgi:hypothetical protein